MFSGRSVLGIGFGSFTVSWEIADIGFTGGTTSSIISAFGVRISCPLHQ